jgi:DNA invertase Pin-like site-specific DNA recombinase
VDLVVLDQGIDTSTAVGRMFFQILGAIAEFGHALMSVKLRGSGRCHDAVRPGSPGWAQPGYAGVLVVW